MDSEQTPLLQADAVYEPFSKSKKKVIVFIISWSGLLPSFVMGTLTPSIPQIAKDLGSTGQVISLAASISIIGACIGGLCGAAYSTFYGRKPVYLVCLPLLCIGSFGVALSKDVPNLMMWCFIQAFGASPGWSVGAGVISDLYKLEERGAEMGIYLAACLLGPTIAPSIGGLAAEYASWRMMQGALGFIGAFSFFATLLFLPETSHSGARGIDKFRAEQLASGSASRRMVVFINPLKPLVLMKSPALVAVSIARFLTTLSGFVMLVPLAYTIGVRYSITNGALIGSCFAPCGIGSMIGPLFNGLISDRVIIKQRVERGGVWDPENRLRVAFLGAFVLAPLSVSITSPFTCTPVILVPLAYTIGVQYSKTNGTLIESCFAPWGIGSMIGPLFNGRIYERAIIKRRIRKGGVWYPEDRLRVTLLGAFVLAPLSVLFSGLFIEYVPGTLGLVLNLVCLFINGIGVEMVLNPLSLYSVDVLRDRSAEAMAAKDVIGSIFLSAAVASILPLINSIGVALTNFIAALLAWLGGVLILLTIHHGKAMRRWVDIGYTTAENN